MRQVDYWWKRQLFVIPRPLAVGLRRGKSIIQQSTTPLREFERRRRLLCSVFIRIRYEVHVILQTLALLGKASVDMVERFPSKNPRIASVNRSSTKTAVDYRTDNYQREDTNLELKRVILDEKSGAD